MHRSRRRLLLLLAVLPFLVLVAALVYMAGMSVLEGESRSFWQALAWAAETLSTTGYGADARWTHPAMVLFVVVLQFLGVFLVFLVFPIYLIPVLEERFEARLPQEAPKARDHLLIYRSGPAVSTLLELADSAGVDTLVMEPDETRARRLFESGQAVIQCGFDDRALERAGLSRARALVANGDDDEDAALILGARQLGFEGDVVALVEGPNHRKPMTLAGATAVYTPRHILGAALAARASERISPRIEGAQLLGDRLVVSELKIDAGSRFAGKTLREADVGRRTGVTLIGQWVDGELVAPLSADTRLEPQRIFLVAGGAESVRRLTHVSGGGDLLVRRSGRFVLAGCGEVGRKVAELLREAGEEVQTVDRNPGDGVDVVGDILDLDTLRQLRLEDAQAVILAVDSDSATLFATVILKDYAPSTQVIARVNQAENVERIHRAGADFALSISQVSGQILAARLLGREGIAVAPRLRVLKVAPPSFAGKTPAELEVRERTGVSVVAVERGEDVLVELGGDFSFQTGDTVFVCGSDSAIEEFLALFPDGG